MTSRTKRFIRITSLVFILSLFLIVSLAYIKYRDFKKAFVAQLSLQTSSFIGQEITIGDISFSPGGEINLYNIAVHNPEGFAPGNLLTIKMLSLKMSYKEFMRKKLYFERIDLQEPELTVMRNSKGLLNISDELTEFFARKPTLPYQIDEFIIQSGIVNFNNDKKYRNEDVNIVIQNLSPERDTKTSLRGHTLYAGSRMEIDGWVYLKDEPKRLSISISSRDLSLSVLKESLSEYGIEITKTKAALFLKAEGDTAKGFNFSSELRIKDAKFSFLKKDAKEMFLKVQAFLNIPGKTLIIDNCSLNAGGVTAMTVKGELKKVKEDFTYTAGVKINMLDLSVVNFVKDVTMSGMVNSEDLHLRGSLKNLFPELSGNVQLRDAKFETRDFGIGQMNTDMQFLSGKDATLDFTVRDLKYGDYKIPWLQAKSGIAYRGHIITLQSPDIVSKDFTVSSQHAVIKLPVNTKQHGVQVEIGGMHASYPERKAGIKNGACSLVVSKVSNVFAGTCGFAADEIVFMDIRTGFVKGHGIFDEKNYSVDITQADLFGGRLGLTAGGRTSGDRFPITIRSTANNINLEYLSRDISKIANISYPLSGDVTSADFEGTIDSVESVKGKAAVRAEKITVPDKNKKRTLVKDGTLEAEIVFKEKDLDIRADAGAGRISANIVGTVKDFGKKNRSGELKISLPEVKVADVREVFWEVFPDSLLYAGMDGSLSSDMLLHFDDSSTGVKGKVVLNNILLTGENGEYSVGPIRGSLPVVYSQRGDKQSPPELPAFERGQFDNIRNYYSGEKKDNGYSLISLGTVSYGFPLVDTTNIWIRPEGKFLHIGHFSGNIFGGKLNGSAIIDLSDLFQYKAGLLIEGLSLTQLCDRIEPIRGYITGKVDGIAMIKGAGAGLSQLIGKADFWTYSTAKEKTKISKEFLHKVGGPSLKRYLGDREFDKGIMSLYFQNGYVIFKELEISNRNFIGVKDLDIKVAPLNNRIAIDHLMWSITEAAYRARKKE